MEAYLSTVGLRHGFPGSMNLGLGLFTNWAWGLSCSWYRSWRWCQGLSWGSPSITRETWAGHTQQAHSQALNRRWGLAGSCEGHLCPAGSPCFAGRGWESFGSMTWCEKEKGISMEFQALSAFFSLLANWLWQNCVNRKHGILLHAQDWKH